MIRGENVFPNACAHINVNRHIPDPQLLRYTVATAENAFKSKEPARILTRMGTRIVPYSAKYGRRCKKNHVTSPSTRFVLPTELHPVIISVRKIFPCAASKCHCVMVCAIRSCAWHPPDAGVYFLGDCGHASASVHKTEWEGEFFVDWNPVRRWR